MINPFNLKFENNCFEPLTALESLQKIPIKVQEGSQKDLIKESQKLPIGLSIKVEMAAGDPLTKNQESRLLWSGSTLTSVNGTDGQSSSRDE